MCPYVENSNVDPYSDINVAASADNTILYLGDWTEFVILDRIGLAVEPVQHVIGSNGHPTGERGWYAWWRVGSDVTSIAAFRVMNIATTA